MWFDVVFIIRVIQFDFELGDNVSYPKAGREESFRIAVSFRVVVYLSRKYRQSLADWPLK